MEVTFVVRSNRSYKTDAGIVSDIELNAMPSGASQQERERCTTGDITLRRVPKADAAKYEVDSEHTFTF